jgi:hypothetical protein
MPFAPPCKGVFHYTLYSRTGKEKQAKHCLLSHFPVIWHYIQVEIGTTGQWLSHKAGWTRAGGSPVLPSLAQTDPKRTGENDL